jgi:hypothetical protein
MAVLEDIEVSNFFVFPLFAIIRIKPINQRVYFP